MTDSQLSEHLTMEKMCYSPTATRRGVNNIPTDNTIIESMKAIATVIYDPLFKHFKHELILDSGYRCEALNRAVSGDERSQHMKGQAMDLIIESSSKSNKDLFDYIKNNLNYDKMICELGGQWIHVSYNKGSNRKIILRSHKNAQNETIYVKYNES